MDEKLFAARVEDTVSLCERTDTPRYFGFLGAAQTAQAAEHLARRGVKFSFFGGYEGAERVFLACLPPWCYEPDYPLTAVTLKFRAEDTVGHRDVLGALMGLGIVREAVGDILLESGRAVVFLRRDIVGYVEEQLTTVGRVGVQVSEGFCEPLPNIGKTQEGTVTVSSLRMDCVVGALCSVSRSGAAQLLSDGKVILNSVGVQKPTKTVEKGDILSVRGYGRFVLGSCDRVSKKGRIILEYSKSV